MEVELRIIAVTKRFPLRISRGVMSGSQNLFVLVHDDGVTGLGEAAPGTGHDPETFAEECRGQLGRFCGEPEFLPLVHEAADASTLAGFAPLFAAMRDAGLLAPAMAALDMAVWDLAAKRLGQPLWHLFGLQRTQVATSVTVGINPPDVVGERAREVLARTGAKALKVKLGSPEGCEHDRASFIAAATAAREVGALTRVDANGGWTVSEAEDMIGWLADNGCDYVEQPLAKGEEERLAALRPSPIPIFVDESVHFVEDIAPVADHVDGANLKLMKCGGLTEALRIVAEARHRGLGTMIGCMGESSVAISAGAAIGSAMDHIDLDSQLNLLDDPATGAPLVDGCLVPPDAPGHGAALTR
ncbi:MAG TPA: dipeptide epimerase [Fimbriimonadaceae bacterium]|nr:dipeptide epimerase [Fimbriimonadaceae bacterium]